MTNPESVLSKSMFSNQQNVHVIVEHGENYLFGYLSLPFQEEEEGGVCAEVLLSEGRGEHSWVSGAE